MYIDELIFEITRKCNAKCSHCLRGDPQNCNISNETIDNVLKEIKGITTLVFTGGEPSLAVDRINYITSRMIALGISVGYFYVVTNGKVASIKFASALLHLYAYIDYPEEAILCISQDQFHEEEIKDIRKTKALYNGLKFFNPDFRKDKIQIVINEGRAVENGFGARDAYIEPLSLEFDEKDQLQSVQSTIYINALGDVLMSCDMSFESQEKYKIDNVNKTPLSKILISYFNKESKNVSR
jgi:organic radical activating enzyme